MEALRFACTHVARLVGLWLAAVVVYALAIARTADVPWLVVDLAIIAGCAYVARRTPREVLWAAAIALLTTLGSQLVVVDKQAIWLDESNYLATLREGRILLDGVAPFNLRWLEPLLAGPLDISPLHDLDALKGLNFGALVATGTYLSWLVLRLGVAPRIALTAPVFLLSSYLGVYAATNRLVLDPFNYCVYVVIAHALVRHPRHLSWILLVGACNSEKVVYWIPIVFAAELLRGRRAVATTLVAAAPAVAYLAIMLVLARGARTETHGVFVEQLYRMAFSPLAVPIRDPVASATTMQQLWFPFGGLSVHAVLGLARSPRWLRALALLLVPVLAQTLIATDTQRMTAYAFIATIPLAMIYLTDAVAEARLGRALFAVFVGVTVAHSYLSPTVHALSDHGLPIALYLLQLLPAIAALDILLPLALVWLHAVTSRRGPTPRRWRPSGG